MWKVVVQYNIMSPACSNTQPLNHGCLFCWTLNKTRVNPMFRVVLCLLPVTGFLTYLFIYLMNPVLLFTVLDLKTGETGYCTKHHLWKIWENARVQPEEVQSVWRHERGKHDRTLVQVSLFGERKIITTNWKVVTIILNKKIDSTCNVQHKCFLVMIKPEELTCKAMLKFTIIVATTSIFRC